MNVNLMKSITMNITPPQFSSISSYPKSTQNLQTWGINGLLVTSLLVAQMAYAVPASPRINVLTQPNNSRFQAHQWGDEFLHGWETHEGYTILLDEHSLIWKYAELSPEGNLVPSPFIVETNPVPKDFPKHLRPNQNFISTILQEKFASLSEEVEEVPSFSISTMNTAKIPVILINFSDTQPTYTPSDFNTLIFGTGNQSVKDYYEEVSYGQFSITGEVSSWYTASHDHDYYGQNDEYGYDLYPQELVMEAIELADADIDFASYDNNGDCYVDVVNIIHQGTDEAGSPNVNDIWSHKWKISYTTHDTAPGCEKIKVQTYTLQAEQFYEEETHPYLLTTIGVFTHEYGHALGLPDLYDIDYSSKGVGRWDLMSYGAWNQVNRGGDSPAHLSAWSKYFLGWVTPTQVLSKLSNELIEAAALKADVYQFLPGNPTPIPSGEYFLVENRQQIGFDQGLPTSGLAIWHIDESKATDYNTGNTDECSFPDNPPGRCRDRHYRVALVQADGQWELEDGWSYGDDGDLYPGYSGNTAFKDQGTLPSSKLYNGKKSNVCVTDISSFGISMTTTLSPCTKLLANIGAFTAQPVYKGIQITWTTTWELESAGFNLYRSCELNEDGNYEEISSLKGAENHLNSGTFSPLVNAKGGKGNSYSYIDTTMRIGETCYYALEEIDMSGTSTLYEDDHGIVVVASKTW